MSFQRSVKARQRQRENDNHRQFNLGFIFANIRQSFSPELGQVDGGLRRLPASVILIISFNRRIELAT